MALMWFLVGAIGVVISMSFQNTTAAMIVGGVSLLFFLLSLRGPGKQRQEGSVFLSGCDTGMGEMTALHLAGTGYHVFAGVYMEESIKKLKDKVKELHGTDTNITPIRFDVTKPETVKQAADSVEKHLIEMKKTSSGKFVGLIGVVNFAAIAFGGPAEWLPLDVTRSVLEVNVLGGVVVTQAMLPLIKKATQDSTARRGRVVFFGTGGGVPAPCPPLLSAYMMSKWAMEAFCQSLRLEMKMAKRRIDCCTINPGFTNPTNMFTAAVAASEKLWARMPPEARQEYGKFFDAFVEYNRKTAGTHPRFVAYAVEQALTDGDVPLRYKVGIDSKVSPLIGIFPTAWREKLVTLPFGASI